MRISDWSSDVCSSDLKRTLSVPALLVEPERPEPFTGFVDLAPKIVAGQADMLPAQRGDVGEQFVGHVDAAAAQMTDGAVEIEGIPERHGRGGEGQAGCTMELVLEGAVAQFDEPVEEDGAGERVAGLDLVEDDAGAAPLVGIVEPVEHEQCALDPSKLAQDRKSTRLNSSH